MPELNVDPIRVAWEEAVRPQIIDARDVIHKAAQDIIPDENHPVRKLIKRGNVPCPDCKDGNFEYKDWNGKVNLRRCDICMGEGQITIKRAYDLIERELRGVKSNNEFLIDSRDTIAKHQEIYSSMLNEMLHLFGLYGRAEDNDWSIERCCQEVSKVMKELVEEIKANHNERKKKNIFEQIVG